MPIAEEPRQYVTTEMMAEAMAFLRSGSTGPSSRASSSVGREVQPLPATSRLETVRQAMSGRHEVRRKLVRILLRTAERLTAKCKQPLIAHSLPVQ